MDVETVSCTGVIPDAVISTSGLAFSPTTASVPVGGILQFAPTGFHTMVSDTGEFDTVTGMATVCLQFNTAGSYPFHCGIHPSMTGTITVP